MSRTIAPFASWRSGMRTSLGLVSLCALLAGCEEPLPRTFAQFMDDRIAREGTIAYCNENPGETANDIECANARRAAATIALRLERERRAELELESERKLEALRREMAERERIVRETTLAAARAEREAYEALWANAPAANAPAANAPGANAPDSNAPDTKAPDSSAPGPAAEEPTPVGPRLPEDRLSEIDQPPGLKSGDDPE